MTERFPGLSRFWGQSFGSGKWVAFREELGLQNRAAGFDSSAARYEMSELQERRILDLARAWNLPVLWLEERKNALVAQRLCSSFVKRRLEVRFLSGALRSKRMGRLTVRSPRLSVKQSP